MTITTTPINATEATEGDSIGFKGGSLFWLITRVDADGVTYKNQLSGRSKRTRTEAFAAIAARGGTFYRMVRS